MGARRRVVAGASLPSSTRPGRNCRPTPWSGSAECLTAEVVRRQRRRRMRLAILCGSLAASLLVVIGGLFYAMQGRQPAGRQPILAQSPALSTEVQDRYRVAMEWPAAVDVPAAPLVPLDEYRTLIGEIH